MPDIRESLDLHIDSIKSLKERLDVATAKLDSSKRLLSVLTTTGRRYMLFISGVTNDPTMYIVGWITNDDKDADGVRYVGDEHGSTIVVSYPFTIDLDTKTGNFRKITIWYNKNEPEEPCYDEPWKTHGPAITPVLLPII